jgi:hypothetical protein
MALNLRGIANGAIQSINPDIPAILRQSSGYTVNEAGKQQNAYRDSRITIQSQPMSSKELQLIEALGLQGVFRAVHMNGNIEGLRRHDEKGADILNFKQYEDSQAFDWLIVQVMESWPNWCRLLLCRQK